MRNITIFACFLALLLPVCSNSAENEEESFYSQLSHAIIRLEHIEHVQQEGSNRVIPRNISDGTGFFVATEKALFIVSARHVVEKPHDLHARVQCRNKKWEIQERCGSKICVLGKCIVPPKTRCTPGEKKCSGNNIVTQT